MKSNHEQVFYLKRSRNEATIVEVYVDDLIIIGSSSNYIKYIKIKMKTKFEMSDLRSLSSYLRLKVK